MTTIDYRALFFKFRHSISISIEIEGFSLETQHPFSPPLSVNGKEKRRRKLFEHHPKCMTFLSSFN